MHIDLLLFELAVEEDDYDGAGNGGGGGYGYMNFPL